MPAKNALQIFERDTTITPRKLRQIGYIPATIYGGDRQPLSIQLKAHEFEVAFHHGIRQFTLEGLGQAITAEVKQVQLNSSKGNVLHIEFFTGTEKAPKKPKATVEAAPPPAEEPIAV